MKQSKRRMVMHEVLCKLTTTETVERGQELDRQEEKYQRIDTEKKSVAKRFTGELEEAGMEIARLAGIITAGKEPRQIECEIVADPVRLVIAYVRTDTGEEVESRPMTAEERQRGLFEAGNRDAAAADVAQLEVGPVAVGGGAGA